MSVSRLEPNKEYSIVSIKDIITKFGPSYIVTDTEFNEYFTPKKVEAFIKTNNLVDNGGDVIFKIVTGPQKSFKKKNENGEEEEIKYIDCRCLKSENKKTTGRKRK